MIVDDIVATKLHKKKQHLTQQILIIQKNVNPFAAKEI